MAGPQWRSASISVFVLLSVFSCSGSPPILRATEPDGNSLSGTEIKPARIPFNGLDRPMAGGILQREHGNNEDWQDTLETMLLEHKQAVVQNKSSRTQFVKGVPYRRSHVRGTRHLLEANGYPVEEHIVRTDDGYILTMFRVPRPGRPVVFLMHGLLASSADYVILGRGRALAPVLYDAGFDVWMGNARGTTPSRKHEWLNPDHAAFWDFTWHEIGAIDLPASIDYVLNATNKSTLHYVGHSQGTTTFFVMGSERPHYMAKIRTFIALAPIAFVRDIRSIVFRLMALEPNTLASFVTLIGVNEFLPNSRFVTWLGDTFCSDGAITQPLCAEIMFLICGVDWQQMNATMIPEILINTPAGASTKQLLHFGQLVHSRALVFRKFDFGWVTNLQRYHSLIPPDYNLRLVNASTYLFYSFNDLLSVKSNLDQLTSKLPNIALDGVRRVSLSQFNHMDYIYGKNAKELVYDHVIDIIRKEETSAAATVA